MENLQNILLKNRGIVTAEEREKFLKPSYERDMNDPLLLHDMERAIVRVFEAIEAKEKIVVYADYDCDGIPGAVIFNDLFAKIGYKNFEIYIPDRHDEGYGLNKDAIEEFIKQKVNLVITVDLGITDVAEVAMLEVAGIDVIVTDHHLPHEILPKAFAVVNPKLNDYKDQMLCGAGVAFKFIQGFVKKYGEYFKIIEGWEKWLLDMAGLATLSDMVPLIGENRAIAAFGLKVLRKTMRPGLLELFSKMKIDPTTMSEDDITFMLTPRINAASRMGSPRRAFELLCERDVAKAKVLAEHLSDINDERKVLVAQIMKEVKKNLGERNEKKVIVIGNPNWRIGVLGIVAGKICEEYNCPAFVWGREGSNGESVVKGSCRSDGSANVVSMMSIARESFIDFGGHELAGGFSVATESIHLLEDAMIASYQNSLIIKSEILENKFEATLSIKDLSEKTYRMVEELGPFGLGNKKPIFLFEKVSIVSAKNFGKEKNHLEIVVGDDEGNKVKAIAFFKTTEDFKNITKGAQINLLATLERSYFGGRSEKRLRIIDIY